MPTFGRVPPAQWRRHLDLDAPGQPGAPAEPLEVAGRGRQGIGDAVDDVGRRCPRAVAHGLNERCGHELREPERSGPRALEVGRLHHALLQQPKRGEEVLLAFAARQVEARPAQRGVDHRDACPAHVHSRSRCRTLPPRSPRRRHGASRSRPARRRAARAPRGPGPHAARRPGAPDSPRSGAETPAGRALRCSISARRSVASRVYRSNVCGLTWRCDGSSRRSF